VARWSDHPMIAFDLETTGVDVETCRIVTACAAIVNTEMAWAPRSWLIDPGIEIPAEASAVHGISTEHARDHGSKPVVALAEIRTALLNAWNTGCPVVIYNAPYDLTVLDRELRRNNLPGLDVRGLVIDPLVLDRCVDRYRKGSRKLEATCKHYRVTLDNAHDATADALAAARVACRILREHPTFDIAVAETLQVLQASAYRSWAAGFEAYLARKGTPEAIDRSWPMREVSSKVRPEGC
jgi:DNA polymerase-3 subunit epsilon